MAVHSPPRALCSEVWEAVGAQPVQRGPSPLEAHLPWDSLWSSGPGPREVSVLSHRRGNELQLEVLILEDAVESRATLGATERPVALAASVLRQFCEESQLQRRGHTSASAVGAEDLWGGWMWDRLGGA